MNEKFIREFANQAGLMVTLVDSKETELAKFAELIIKECAEVAQGYKGCGEYFTARASAKSDILKHFGVK